MDRRDSTRAALEKYLKREAKKSEPKVKRSNSKPEKITESECLTWLRSQGFSVQIFESKATYDPRRGVWRQQSMQAGTADCMGSDPSGNSVVIEFKAKGKLKSFNRHTNQRQQMFIKEKIEANCFACVVDSVDLLREIYTEWASLRLRSVDEAKSYLLKALP